MQYLAGFGGIILTFLAAPDRYENDEKTMKESLADRRHVFPLFLCCGRSHGYFLLHWNIRASLIAGIALSTTSLAVVYSVLIEAGCRIPA